MRLRLLMGVVAVAVLSPLAMAASARQVAPSSLARAATPDPNLSPSYRLLNKPTSSDERLQQRGLRQEAQGLSDRLFAQLAPLLGGDSPQINSVSTGSPLAPNHLSASTTPGNPYKPVGTISADPLAMAALIDNNSPYHSGFVNGFPHEMAHLHQLAEVLGSVPIREGGAQAFADMVTPAAARKAGLFYDQGGPGEYDGSYAQYVKTVQQPPYGRDWILGGQFGKTGSPVWP